MGQIKKIIIHDHARWSLARNRKQRKEYVKILDLKVVTVA